MRTKIMPPYRVVTLDGWILGEEHTLTAAGVRASLLQTSWRERGQPVETLEITKYAGDGDWDVVEVRNG